MEGYELPESGLGGVERYRKARNLSKQKALAILRGIDAYTLHVPVRRNFNRRRIIALAVNELWQIDLADFSKYKRFNGGYRYVLVAIDSLSRFARVAPLKTKRPLEVKKALMRLFRGGNIPYKILSDEGGEFKNSTVKDYLQRKKIHHYSTFTGVKASQAERFIRTLRDRVFRYFRVTGKYHYVSALPRIVQDYNHSKHRTIGMSPAEVNAENEMSVFNKVNGKPVVPSVKKKLNVGDRVRVLLHRRTFQKGSEGSWSPQIYTISRLRNTSPPVVYLKDYQGKDIKGCFYPEEVTVVADVDRWPVEKVLRKKNVKGRSYSLVRWFGYDSEHDSWVPSEEVIKIGSR